jgi:hypothetical protein
VFCANLLELANLHGDVQWLPSTIGWKDETTPRSFKVPLAGIGVSSESSLNVGATSNFGSGELSLWLAGDAITYSTAYILCKTGTGSYSLRIVAEKLQ